MVSHNPQWLEHSNSGRAQYQGSVGNTERKRKVRRDDFKDSLSMKNRSET